MPIRPTTQSQERRRRMEMTGRRIRFARQQAGLTQDELARRVGFSNGKWLSEIENGRNSIDVHDLAAVAQETGFPLEYFVDPDYKSQQRLTPRTRLDWELLFPDQPARARAHADLDQVFRDVTNNKEDTV